MAYKTKRSVKIRRKVSTKRTVKNNWLAIGGGGYVNKNKSARYAYKEVKGRRVLYYRTKSAWSASRPTKTFIKK